MLQMDKSWIHFVKLKKSQKATYSIVRFYCVTFWKKWNTVMQTWSAVASLVKLEGRLEGSFLQFSSTPLSYPLYRDVIYFQVLQKWDHFNKDSSTGGTKLVRKE